MYGRDKNVAASQDKSENYAVYGRTLTSETIRGALAEILVKRCSIYEDFRQYSFNAAYTHTNDFLLSRVNYFVRFDDNYDGRLGGNVLTRFDGSILSL